MLKILTVFFLCCIRSLITYKCNISLSCTQYVSTWFLFFWCCCCSECGCWMLCDRCHWCWIFVQSLIRCCSYWDLLLLFSPFCVCYFLSTRCFVFIYVFRVILFRFSVANLKISTEVVHEMYVFNVKEEQDKKIK